MPPMLAVIKGASFIVKKKLTQVPLLALTCFEKVLQLNVMHLEFV